MRSIIIAAWLFSAVTSTPAFGETAAGATIADLAGLRDIGGPYGELAVSPDGETAAVIERRADFERNDYRYVVVAIDIASARSREIADAGGFVLRSDGGRRAGVGILRQPQFSDSRTLYFLRENAGAVQIWAAAIDGGGARALTPAAGDVRRFRVDGARIVFETSTPREALRADAERRERLGFRIDDRLAPSYSLEPMPDIDRDIGVWTLDLATLALGAGDADDAALLADAPRPHVRPLDPNLQVVEPPVGVFGADGARCGDAACSAPITHTWGTRDEIGDAILFRRLEGHARSTTAFYHWRSGQHSARLVWRGEERTEGCTPTSEALICLQDSAAAPRRVVSIRLSDGRLRALYDPNPQWRQIARPRIERFDYTDREGNESFAHLVYPLNWRRNRLYPLVVVQYRSRGFLLGGVGDETPILPLSARGYFVLSFDRPEFREREQRMSYPALHREIELQGIERSAKREALMHFIERAAERGADRGRIAITGLSDGAETAYAMLMDEPIFAAAVVSTPPTDPIGWELQSPAVRDYLFRRDGLTGPWEDAPEPWRSWWRDNSPVFHVERIRAPILFNLAEAEALRAFPLMTRMREERRAFEAYLYPGAYHLKWRPMHIRTAQQRTLDWLDFWLRGVERVDENDPGRLDRWRGLRALQAE